MISSQVAKIITEKIPVPTIETKHKTNQQTQTQIKQQNTKRNKTQHKTP